MVSAAELRQQQQALRGVGARIPLQLQQQALQRGVSPQRILQERERKRVQAEITQSQKEQALIVEDVLRQAGSVQQLEQLLQTVPQEIRQFIKTTPEQIQGKINSTISKVQERIKTQQKVIDNLRITRKRFAQEGNQIRAREIDADLAGISKEINFLKGTLPQLGKGSFIPFSEIKSVGSDVRFGEEERRIALEKQFSQLATALPGGRQELSKIFKERRITIEQQTALGIITGVKVKAGETISKNIIGEFIQDEINRFNAGRTSLANLKENIAILGKQGGFSASEQRKIISSIEKERVDIFGFKREPTVFEEISGLDFAGMGGIDIGGFQPISKLDIPKAKTFKETKEDFRKLGGDILTGAEKIAGFLPRQVALIEKEKEKELAELGIFKPTKEEQIKFPKRETLEFQPQFLTDIEIKEQPFGGGLGVLQQRRQTEAEFDLNKLAKREADRLFPSFKIKAENEGIRLQNQVNNEKISVEQANTQLNIFIDKLQKEFQTDIKKVTDKKANKLGKDITKEIESAFESNAIKRSLVLFSANVVTGFAFGFVGALSVPLAVGIGIFGGIEVAKTTPTIVKAFRQGDIQTLGSIGIDFTAFGIGGFAGAKVGGKIVEVTRIRPALERASIETKTISRDLNILRKLKLPENIKAEIITLIDRGFSIRLIETKLKALNKADAKILPDVRGRFLEILNRNGVIVDVINLGSVVSSKSGKTFTRDILSESIGKVTEKKITFSTRSVIGKFKGDKFKPLNEIITFQETRILRKKETPTERILLSETITKKVGEARLKGAKPVDITKIQKGLLGDTFGLKKVKPDLLKLESEFLIGKKGKPISKTRTITREKITGIDLAIDNLISTKDIAGIKVTRNFGDLLSSIRKSEAKSRGFTIKIPEIEFPKVKKVPRDTLKEVFGVLEDVKKPKPPKPKKVDTSQVLDFSKQQKQINENLNKLTQTTTPEVVTRAVAKELAKPIAKPTLVFGKIKPFEDLGQIGDLGVLKSRLGEGLLTGLETKQEQKTILKQREKQRAKIKFQFPNITGVIGDLGQLQLQFPGIAQIQPQAQLTLQLQKLNTNLAGFQIQPPTIIDIVIPKIPVPTGFFFPDKEKLRTIPKPKAEQGWDIFVKSLGKQNKINKVPLRQDMALDYGSFIVDNSISQQFSIRKSGKRAKQPKANFPVNYWEINKSKFNDFKIKKGRRIPTPNVFQEKRINAIDTFGEIRNLSSARLIKQSQKTPQQSFQQFDITKKINFNNSFSKRKRKRKKK